jgi:hypothetical protein
MFNIKTVSYFIVVTKAIATSTTYYKEIEEIKMMCSLCLVIEVFLVWHV